MLRDSFGDPFPFALHFSISEFNLGFYLSYVPLTKSIGRSTTEARKKKALRVSDRKSNRNKDWKPIKNAMFELDGQCTLIGILVRSITMPIIKAFIIVSLLELRRSYAYFVVHQNSILEFQGMLQRWQSEATRIAFVTGTPYRRWCEITQANQNLSWQNYKGAVQTTVQIGINPFIRQWK